MEIEPNAYKKLQNDFEFGTFMTDHLIPNVILYYLNEIDYESKANEISRIRSNV